MEEGEVGDAEERGTDTRPQSYNFIRRTEGRSSGGLGREMI